MIKFFRKIRQRLLTENKFSKYLLYAIGEIALVMIGILLALQVNNWNNNNKDRELEQLYISGLILDLQADSIAIADLMKASDDQVRRKEKLKEYFEGQPFSNDSIYHFFSLQWGLSFSFNPNTTTFDEMKSTGRIGVIQNPALRKTILKTYNNYQIFVNSTQAYYESQRWEIRKLAFKIPRVFDVESLDNVTKPDIIEALKKDELKNMILANYAVSVHGGITILQQANNELLVRLGSYLSAF